MTSSSTGAELERAAAGLAPYARSLIRAAADNALRLHAEEVAPEHLLIALLSDGESAAYGAVVHLFADPETICAELLALAPGVLVIGSGRSLPFSTRGAQALQDARALAVTRASGAVTPAHLLLASVHALPHDARADLERAGLAIAGLDEASSSPAPAGADVALPADGPLLASFTEDAIALCGVACRTATQLRRETISPAHLLFAALERHANLRESSGLDQMRARAILTGRDDDTTPPAPRALNSSPELTALLANAPEGADSLALLNHAAAASASEVRLLLGQHRVEPEALATTQGRFRDPDTLTQD